MLIVEWQQMLSHEVNQGRVVIISYWAAADDLSMISHVQIDPQSEIRKKIQMATQKFRLISGLAKLTPETKITSEMWLVANIFGWNTAEQHFKVQK